MSVRLNTIPDAKDYPKKTGCVKWIMVSLLLPPTVLVSVFLPFRNEFAISGWYFWGAVSGIFIFIWSLAVSVYWLVFITQCIRVEAWNKRREEVILRETQRGRRALQILNLSLHTAMNGDSLVETTMNFLTRQSRLSTYSVLRGENMVRRSVIPVLTDQPITSRLPEIISRLFSDIKPQLCRLPDDFHINVFFEINTSLSVPIVIDICKDEWQKAGFSRTCLFSNSARGLAVIDDWLDNDIHKKAVLLVISLHLEPEQSELTAESACALLMANRLPQQAITPLALLHRPERLIDTTAMVEGIKQALDWMPVKPDALSGTWTATLNAEQRVALLSLNEPFIQEASLYELDAFLGRSDMAAPWLSIAAATLAGMHLHQPQLALSGEQGGDSLWAAVVSPHALAQEAS